MKRLNTLRAEAPSLLSGFYEPRLKSFSIKPEPEMQENFNGNRPTAQVLKFVFSMRRTISDLMLNAVLEEFKGTDYSGKRKKKKSSWDRLLDTKLGNPCEKGCRTIKDILEHRVIEPFANSIESPSYGAAYSAILFGPPGGAKTTIVEAVAQRMGYDFVCIDTTTLLEDGLSNAKFGRPCH